MNRIEKLAERIVHYSCEIKKGQKVIIEMTGSCSKPLVIALIGEVNKIDGFTTVINKDLSIIAEQIKGITKEDAKYMAGKDLNLISEADVYIMIKSIENVNVMENVPADKMDIYTEYYTKVVNTAILDTTRWLSLRYPNNSMAARAGMDIEVFEDYYFDVCNLDYHLLSQAMDYLVHMMKQIERVRITGPKTDVSFSVKDIPVHKCAGIINLPDGEVYTAPVRDSVNGFVTFNVPTIYNGVAFEEIYLEFEQGKIVDTKSDNKEALESILSTDDGARYIGEFALGVNPYIKKPTKDILFDEKIAGSFHLTPGFCYSNASNGNESAIHWDLICIQTESHGGGEIYFDGKLIRKNGLFVIEELYPLNP